MCSKLLMRLKILNESERIITDNVKNIKIGVFPVNDDNRNWFVIFWKVWITTLNANRLIIQFFNYVYYNSKKESIEEKRKCARWFLIDFNFEIIVIRTDLRESLIKCWTTFRII